ncbi:hypothetical protein PQ478_09220 [Alkalihalophilus pseudofirmus]|uniref:hypothetical protein n=1 Tax=Alkalihalophilus pseudofirmus TaxID=79885 RepID=UPI00259B9D17|nr:hypothetical protein [Alkalihalophilus pseudofirmus]WEG18649.1 hypothetical protein PQ478_09220 [Alkalihalophilus pseudofirmus]
MAIPYDLKLIKPKVKGESDKYSWNLYKYLHKITSTRHEGKYIKNQLEVHWLRHSRFDGEHIEFDQHDLRHFMVGQVIIFPFGLGKSHLNFMNSVLSKGRCENFANVWNKESFTDITDWFFETYLKDGRCIFDREHNMWMTNTDDRYYQINSNNRKCKWCGEHQHREIEKRVEINRIENWVSA